MHSDQKYIEALRVNDPILIKEIYTLYAREARRWVEQHGGTAADARDVFQEAVLALFEKAQSGDFVLTCPLGALLQVIYSRKWIDKVRLNKREQEVRNQEFVRYEENEQSEDLLVLAEDTLRAEASQGAMAAAFAQLSEICQQLLRFLVEGIPAKEVAQRLQMNSVDTLYRRKNACSQRWRALFSNPSN